MAAMFSRVQVSGCTRRSKAAFSAGRPNASAIGCRTLKPLARLPRDHVAEGVVPNVPHVDAPRWIGEHLEHIIFRFGSVFRHLKGVGVGLAFCHLASVSLTL